MPVPNIAVRRLASCEEEISIAFPLQTSSASGGHLFPSTSAQQCGMAVAKKLVNHEKYFHVGEYVCPPTPHARRLYILE